MPSPVNFYPPDTSYIVQTAHTVNYFTKGVDQNGPFCLVEYLIANYLDSDAFLTALLGFVDQSGGPSGSTSKIAPHEYPLLPGLYCCAAAVVEGLGGPAVNSDGLPFYNGGCLIRAEYRPWIEGDYVPNPNTQIDPSTPLLWCTQEIEDSCEIYLLPKTYLKWGDGPLNGQQTDVQMPVRIAMSLITLTFRRVPYLPTGFSNYLGNRTNDATFLGFGAGKVICLPPVTTRRIDTSGATVYDLRLQFQARQEDWNKLINPKDMTFATVTGSDGTSKPYTQIDFSPLLNY